MNDSGSAFVVELDGTPVERRTSSIPDSTASTENSLNKSPPPQKRKKYSMRNPLKLSFHLPRRHKSEPPATNGATTSLIPLLAPGDQPVPMLSGQKVSALEIRDLNELIRKRYALDIEIWSKRDCRPRDRKVVEDKMRRSDAALLKIMAIVEIWDKPDVWESQEDWRKMTNIRERLEMEAGKRVWTGNPPWGAENGRGMNGYALHS